MKNYEHIHADDRASQYAILVVTKKIDVSIPVYNACKRHLNDIKRSHQNLKSFPFYWDYEQSNQIINFGELMINPSTNELLKLEAFQDFILGSINGWKTTQSYRRFRLANISLARKNSKSMLLAILSIYELILGDSPNLNRQIYIGANTQKQANQLFEQIQIMMDKIRANDKWIRDNTKMVFNKIEHISSYSKIETVSEEMKNLDGKNPTTFIWDEAHEAQTDRMYKAMKTGMIQQKNGLIVVISTVGYNLNSDYKKMYDDAKKIASGEVKSERTFSYIAEGIEDDIHNPKNWIKSNPLLSNKDVGKMMKENLMQDYQEGLRNNDLREFIVKNLNIWTQANENSFVPADVWQACADKNNFNIKNKKCYVSLDLSRTNDITAINFLIPLSDEKFYTFAHSFVSNIISIEAKSKQDKIDYQKFIEKGYLTLSDSKSGFISFSQVIKKMFKIIEENNLDVIAILYDPWASDKFILEYETLANGTDYIDIPFISVKQDYKTLSQPIKELQIKIHENKIIHDNNPLVNIAINNAITKYDNNNNILIDKSKQRNKIDNLIALIIGFYEARMHEYQKEKININSFIESGDFSF